MLRAEIRMEAIEYERTFETLFPMLMQMVNGMQEENLPVRLLRRLGETSKNVVTGILRKLSHRHQDEILCGLIRCYRTEICQQINALLCDKGYGGCITVGQMDAAIEEGGMLLRLNCVDVNYAELLKKEHVQQAIGYAAEESRMGQIIQRFSGDGEGRLGRLISGGVASLSRQKGTGAVVNFFRGDIEKQALSWLEKKYLPEELGRMMSDFLEKKGIYARVAAVAIVKTEEAATGDMPERLFGKELECAMVDAVAEYIKELDEAVKR